MRPARGPFRVVDYVFFYDQSDQTPGPNHWRGVARVVGHEGSTTVWISHRGLLIASSPEHLAHANEEDIRGWMVASNETTLLDAMPAAGRTSFLDIRSRPVPPSEGFPQDMPSDSKPELEEKKADEEYTPSEPRPADEQPPQQSDREDLSASSTSMGRMELESERDRKCSIKSYEFFEEKKNVMPKELSVRDCRLWQTCL